MHISLHYSCLDLLFLTILSQLLHVFFLCSPFSPFMSYIQMPSQPFSCKCYDFPLYLSVVVCWWMSRLVLFIMDVAKSAVPVRMTSISGEGCLVSRGERPNHKRVSVIIYLITKLVRHLFLNIVY